MSPEEDEVTTAAGVPGESETERKMAETGGEATEEVEVPNEKEKEDKAEEETKEEAKEAKEEAEQEAKEEAKEEEAKEEKKEETKEEATKDEEKTVAGNKYTFFVGPGNNSELVAKIPPQSGLEQPSFLDLIHCLCGRGQLQSRYGELRCLPTPPCGDQR
eukprot:1223202-Rhodomonas_salina.2